MFQLLLILVAAAPALACDPKPVQNLVTALVNTWDFKVSWSAPSAADLQCIRGYRICSTADTSSADCDNVLNPTMKEYTLVNLFDCTQYNVSIVTLGKNDTTSEPVSLTTTTAPFAVGGHDDLHVVRKDDDTVTALWNYFIESERPCDAQFQVSLCVGYETNCFSTNVTVGSSENYTQDLPKKRDCNGYFVDLVVLGSNQQKSENYRIPAGPDIMGVPEHMKVTNYTSSSFAVDWTIPDSQANCQYFVRLFTKHVVGSTTYHYEVVYDGGTTSYRKTDATACTAYTVSVTFGTSRNDKSTAIKVYTLPKGDKIFEKATVRDATSSSVAVAWSSSLPNDQCIAAYIVCWKTQGSARVDCQNSTNKDHFQITGLAANTRYQVLISALLHIGTEFDKVTLDASTTSGAAGIARNSLAGISAMLFLQKLYI